MSEYVIYADQTMCEAANKDLGYPKTQITPENIEPWPKPFILMIDRGNCTMATKVRNAQLAGAAAVVIADDRCVCDDTQCMVKYTAQTCQSEFPPITGDGSEDDISIPSFLLNIVDAKAAIDSLTANNPMQMELTWGSSASSRVEYAIWSGVHGTHGTDFLKLIKHVAVGLGDRAVFTPHMYIFSGDRYDCTKHEREDNRETCDALCTNGGRYCSNDHHVPDGKGGFVTITGAQTVKESLRRLCIWEHYGKIDGIGVPFWNYLEKFTERCGNQPEYFSNDDCIKDVLIHTRIDPSQIDDCMSMSGDVNQDDINHFLDVEIAEQKKNGIVSVPSIVINGKPMKGPVNSWSIFFSLCSDFLGDAPEVCSRCSYGFTNDLATCVGTGGDIVEPAAPKKKKRHHGRNFFITFLILGTIGGAGFWYYKKHQDNQNNIIADYMPFMSSNDGV
eukprot:CAMPEP_0116554630 /NCGR_PEP_ID=MMETSP0397-20121206/7699_1 /TAXON_ID=216820 /ORGANISM="Cyclophora tenuis, Strain ECT3854" /LENGTH=445 /DNA_ID=CAMNT_0004079813 /DNA_START=110 /DNA_END=1447 /DNA_ORIENTATION=-